MSNGAKIIPFPTRTRIQLRHVVFDGAEGSEIEKAPFLKRPYTSWAAANKAVKDMAFYSNKAGGYDKTNFVATWQDGDTYEGRIDISYKMHAQPRPLTQHVVDEVAFVAGIYQPAHLSDAQYKELFGHYNRQHPGRREAAKLFLLNYELGEYSNDLPGTPPAQKTLREQSAEKETEKKTSETKRLASYPPPVTDRDEAIRRIKDALKKRSGKVWSVTGGKGTSWGWIRIQSPPKRLVGEFGYMSPAECQELAKLLGKDKVHQQGESIPAGNDYRTEYVDRAEGRPPRKTGTPYWD